MRTPSSSACSSEYSLMDSPNISSGEMTSCGSVVINNSQRWLVIRGFVRWRLATLHGKRAGFPAGSRWSAAGRFENMPAEAGLWKWDLEAVGWSLPWEEGEELKMSYSF